MLDIRSLINRSQDFRIGQILVHLDVVTQYQVADALAMQMVDKPSKRIGEIMIELGYITKEDLHRALSLQRDLGIL